MARAGTGPCRTIGGPAGPVSAPVALATTVGERWRRNPCRPRDGAHLMLVVVAACVLDLHAAQVGRGDDRAHVQLDTPLRRSRAAMADGFGPNEASGALPPSNSRTRASSGLMCRYSSRSVLVATSRICPASSTPVGPAPTTAKVSQRRRSAGSVAHSATSNAPNTRRRIFSASSIDFIPGANAAYSSCPNRTARPQPPGSGSRSRTRSPRPAAARRQLLGVRVDAGHLRPLRILDVAVLGQQCPQRERDLPLRQNADRALVEQRLEAGDARPGRSASPGPSPAAALRAANRPGEAAPTITTRSRMSRPWLGPLFSFCMVSAWSARRVTPGVAARAAAGRPPRDPQLPLA